MLRVFDAAHVCAVGGVARRVRVAHAVRIASAVRAAREEQAAHAVHVIRSAIDFVVLTQVVVGAIVRMCACTSVCLCLAASTCRPGCNQELSSSHVKC